MRDAVKFLLDRMDTNPEEFYQQRTVNGKHEWLTTINAYKKFFNEEEKELVQAKLSEINLEQMKTFVVNKLLTQDEEEKEILHQQALTELVKAFEKTKLEEKKIHISAQQLKIMQEIANERTL